MSQSEKTEHRPDNTVDRPATTARINRGRSPLGRVTAQPPTAVDGQSTTASNRAFGGLLAVGVYHRRSPARLLYRLFGETPVGDPAVDALPEAPPGAERLAEARPTLQHRTTAIPAPNRERRQQSDPASRSAVSSTAPLSDHRFGPPNPRGQNTGTHRRDPNVAGWTTRSEKPTQSGIDHATRQLSGGKLSPIRASQRRRPPRVAESQAHRSSTHSASTEQPAVTSTTQTDGQPSFRTPSAGGGPRERGASMRLVGTGHRVQSTGWAVWPTRGAAAASRPERTSSSERQSQATAVQSPAQSPAVQPPAVRRHPNSRPSFVFSERPAERPTASAAASREPLQHEQGASTTLHEEPQNQTTDKQRSTGSSRQPAAVAVPSVSRPAASNSLRHSFERSINRSVSIKRASTTHKTDTSGTQRAGSRIQRQTQQRYPRDQLTTSTKLRRTASAELPTRVISHQAVNYGPSRDNELTRGSPSNRQPVKDESVQIESTYEMAAQTDSAASRTQTAVRRTLPVDQESAETPREPATAWPHTRQTRSTGPIVAKYVDIEAPTVGGASRRARVSTRSLRSTNRAYLSRRESNQRRTTSQSVGVRSYRGTTRHTHEQKAAESLRATTEQPRLSRERAVPSTKTNAEPAQSLLPTSRRRIHPSTTATRAQPAEQATHRATAWASSQSDNRAVTLSTRSIPHGPDSLPRAALEVDSKQSSTSAKATETPTRRRTQQPPRGRPVESSRRSAVRSTTSRTEPTVSVSAIRSKAESVSQSTTGRQLDHLRNRTEWTGRRSARTPRSGRSTGVSPATRTAGWSTRQRQTAVQTADQQVAAQKVRRQQSSEARPQHKPSKAASHRPRRARHSVRRASTDRGGRPRQQSTVAESPTRKWPASQQPKLSSGELAIESTDSSHRVHRLTAQNATTSPTIFSRIDRAVQPKTQLRRNTSGRQRRHRTENREIDGDESNAFISRLSDNGRTLPAELTDGRRGEPTGQRSGSRSRGRIAPKLTRLQRSQSTPEQRRSTPPSSPTQPATWPVATHVGTESRRPESDDVAPSLVTEFSQNSKIPQPRGQRLTAALGPVGTGGRVTNRKHRNRSNSANSARLSREKEVQPTSLTARLAGAFSRGTVDGTSTDGTSVDSTPADSTPADSTPADSNPADSSPASTTTTSTKSRHQSPDRPRLTFEQRPASASAAPADTKQQGESQRSNRRRSSINGQPGANSRADSHRGGGQPTARSTDSPFGTVERAESQGRSADGSVGRRTRTGRRQGLRAETPNTHQQHDSSPAESLSYDADVDRLVETLYRRLERRVRIERERRGR